MTGHFEKGKWVPEPTWNPGMLYIDGTCRAIGNKAVLELLLEPSQTAVD